MHRHLMWVCATTALIAAPSVRADLLETCITVEDIGPPGATTYRVHLEFDDAIPLDQLRFVHGRPGPGPIAFRTNTILLNDGGLDAGTRGEDFPSPTAAPWDSWVTLGTKEPSPDLRFTPWFLGGGDMCKIQGSGWTAHDGGWYDADLDSPVLGGRILIAQLTVADDPLGNPGHVCFEGFAEWWEGSDSWSRIRAFACRSAMYGGCCLPDGQCVVVTPADCLDAGGISLGDDAPCEGEPCAPPCPADIDGDTRVGASDLVAVVMAWGESGDHTADVNDDGIVNVNDLNAVIVGWGLCP